MHDPFCTLAWNNHMQAPPGWSRAKRLSILSVTHGFSEDRHLELCVLVGVHLRLKITNSDTSTLKSDRKAMHEGQYMLYSTTSTQYRNTSATKRKSDTFAPKWRG